MKASGRIALLGAVTISGLALWLAAVRSCPELAVPVSPAAHGNAAPIEKRSIALIDEVPCDAAAEEAEEALTDAEKIEQAEDAKMGAFDDATDAWVDASEDGVTMAAVDAYIEIFQNVPKDRQEECAQRAANLIPDENIMLLTGLLLDKRTSQEVCELIFADILNRDEAVKLPILRQIQMDKSHPCWEDANWMLE